MRKSRMICFAWTLLGIMLIILVARFAGTSSQGTIGNMAILYVFGSCILSGVMFRLVKKERRKKRE